MSYLNKQISTYLEEKELKSHQKRTLEILAHEEIPAGDVLELGSANGRMLVCMADIFPDRNIDGVEIAENLHKIAQERTSGLANVECIHSDIQKFNPDKKYAVVVAEGVHSIFDDPENEILKWMDMVQPGGLGVVFGLFSRANFDFRFYYKNLENNYGWESGLNGTSIKTMSEVLGGQGYSFRFEPLALSFDLPRTSDPIRSYTQNIGEEKSLIVGDALITHMYHLIIRKNAS